MSASLVGSEMCIRDRLWPQPRCDLKEWPVIRRPGSTDAPATRLVRGTVSYTHLTLPTICSV
eukprot:11181215-Alexandrium_andersonii.AAC.1